MVNAETKKERTLERAEKRRDKALASLLADMPAVTQQHTRTHGASHVGFTSGTHAQYQSVLGRSSIRSRETYESKIARLKIGRVAYSTHEGRRLILAAEAACASETQVTARLLLLETHIATLSAEAQAYLRRHMASGWSGAPKATAVEGVKKTTDESLAVNIQPVASQQNAVEVTENGQKRYVYPTGPAPSREEQIYLTLLGRGISEVQAREIAGLPPIAAGAAPAARSPRAVRRTVRMAIIAGMPTARLLTAARFFARNPHKRVYRIGGVQTWKGDLVRLLRTLA
jgi:hypothetical protein